MRVLLKRRETIWLIKSGGEHIQPEDLPDLKRGCTLLLENGSELVWVPDDRKFAVLGYTESNFLSDVAPVADAREYYQTH